jgi:Uma2 family endonuclease
MPTATRTVPKPKKSGAVDLRALNGQQVDELAEQLDGQPVPRVRMSESAFVEWCQQEDVRAEWVDGEVILMAPISDEQSTLNIWLIRLIGDFVETRALGTIRFDMFVRFPAQRRRRVPDLLFVAADRTNVIKRTTIEGPPDLIVEIVSSDSQSRDRRDKYLEYEKAGVREYWLIDPVAQTAEAYRLKGKKFVLLARNDLIESVVLPKFRLDPKVLWKRPLPKPSQVLRRMRAKR